MHYAGGPDVKYASWESVVTGRTTAWVTRSGHEIVFRAALVDIMPDDVLDSLIADVIATALTIARTAPLARSRIAGKDVRALAREWGFDPSDFVKWQNEQGRQKRMEWRRKRGLDKASDEIDLSQ
jgi:hypothetical protein